jgi:hypothetical protein
MNRWNNSKNAEGVLLVMKVWDPSALTHVEVKEQIDQSIWKNRRIITDKTASEMVISHRKNRCKNGLRTKRNYCILGKLEIVWTVELKH